MSTMDGKRKAEQMAVAVQSKRPRSDLVVKEPSNTSVVSAVSIFINTSTKYYN